MPCFLLRAHYGTSPFQYVAITVVAEAPRHHLQDVSEVLGLGLHHWAADHRLGAHPSLRLHHLGASHHLGANRGTKPIRSERNSLLLRLVRLVVEE